MSERPLGGVLLLAALSVLWGSNWPALKVALRELDPWTFRTVCLLVGGGGLLVLVRAGGQSLRVPRAERWPLAVVAFFNITAWHLCSAYGVMLVQAGRAAIIAYTMPLWTVVFSRLMVGERITRSRLAALAWGWPGWPRSWSRTRRPSGRRRQARSSCWVPRCRGRSGRVLTKARRWTMPTAALTGWQLVLGAVPIALGAALRLAGEGDAGLTSRLASLSRAALFGTAYSTFVGVIFCHWAWFRLVAILPAAVAAIGTLGIPDRRALHERPRPGRSRGAG